MRDSVSVQRNGSLVTVFYKGLYLYCDKGHQRVQARAKSSILSWDVKM